MKSDWLQLFVMKADWLIAVCDEGRLVATFSMWLLLPEHLKVGSMLPAHL